MTDEDEHFTIGDEEWNRLEEEKAENERKRAAAEAGRKYGHGGRVVDNGNGNGKDKKQAHYVQKYTESGLIAEAVIVGGIPYFALAKANSNIITLEESIAIDKKNEYKPFEQTAYLSEPYKFESREHFKTCVEKASAESRDSLYRRVKSIWRKYIDADDFHISICTADTIFTYFQDKIGLTHYLFFVGSPGSGKSNNLLVLKYLAYRNFTSTDMTAANIYQFLGSGEEGQGTLCEDEADRIDEDRQKMAIHKNGYIKGFSVARTETSFGRKQHKYNTFCWKAFAAENFPDAFKAKGFNQKVLELQCSFGDPDYDITEVTSPAGDEGFQHLLDELNEMRNTLLIVRLIIFNIKIPDIKLNIKGREKQLFKPVLRVFQKTAVLNDLLPVVSRYVAQKREANYSTLYAFLYRAIKDLISDRQTSQLESGFIWEYIRSNLQGADVPGKALSYDTSEFGVLSQKEITQTLDHIFGAKVKKSHGKKMLNFDISKLKRLGKIYDLSTEVRVIEGEQTAGDDVDVGDDVGMARYIAASTDEYEKDRKIAISEREGIPTNGPIESPNGPHGLNRPPIPSPTQTQDAPEVANPTPSDTSHSTYEHLIVTEDMPTNGKTAYHCKEHYHIWDTDLKGLEIGHFEPFHNNDNCEARENSKSAAECRRGLTLSKYDDIGQPLDPDFWEPKTKTEREVLESMRKERELKPLMFQWFGSTPTSSELKDIRIAYDNYHYYRRRGYTCDSDLDLEMLLERVRLLIVTSEDLAEESGEHQWYHRGVMNAYRGFLWDIICLHEAKKKLKQELERDV